VASPTELSGAVYVPNKESYGYETVSSADCYRADCRRRTGTMDACYGKNPRDN